MLSVFSVVDMYLELHHSYFRYHAGLNVFCVVPLLIAHRSSPLPNHNCFSAFSI